MLGLSKSLNKAVKEILYFYKGLFSFFAIMFIKNEIINSDTYDIFRLIESIKNERRKEMRVKSINNVDAFFKALDKCKGRVELITDEKDVLNLASKLTQFIGLTRVFSNPEINFI